MGNLPYILLSVLILGFLILVHELGHFWVGRFTGIAIHEFSIGFGPRLWGRVTKKNTQISLRALPIGGYVAFVGEDEENDNPDAMNNKPVWKRFLTILAGASMNLIVAFVLIVVVQSAIGLPFASSTIAEVGENTPAQQAGILPGDRVIRAGEVEIGATAEDSGKLSEVISALPEGQPVELTILRGEETLSLSIVPAQSQGRKLIGVTMATDYQRVGIGRSIPGSFSFMRDMVVQMLDVLRNLVFGRQDTSELMGIVGIVDVISTQAQSGIGRSGVLYLIAMLSVNLGLFNLLPLPALDGGRLLILAVEAVRRKPIDRKVEAIVHLVGLAGFLLLTVLITYQDIMRLIRG